MFVYGISDFLVNLDYVDPLSLLHHAPVYLTPYSCIHGSPLSELRPFYEVEYVFLCNV